MSICQGGWGVDLEHGCPPPLIATPKLWNPQEERQAKKARLLQQAEELRKKQEAPCEWKPSATFG